MASSSSPSSDNTYRRLFVHQWFQETAEDFPASTAIDYLSRRITYSELEESSRRVASALIKAGAVKGDLVAIMTEDRVAAITAILGTLRSGCAFAPMPLAPAERLETMLSLVEPSWIITESRLAEQCRETRDRAGLTSHILNIDDLPSAGNLPLIDSDPNDLCYIFFTSGSTGQPKAIAGRLRSIDHFIRWEIKTLQLQPGTRVSQFIAPTFDAVLRDIFVPLCSGGSICIPPGPEVLFDGERLMSWIEDQDINLIHCVPSLFRSLFDHLTGADRLSSLRYVLLAGEAMLPSDVTRWCGIFGSRIQLVNLYGPSETTMTKFVYFVKPDDRNRSFIPIGKPMDGARALLLDERNRPCLPGVMGEIYIRTPFRSLGYYKRPDLTSQVFSQNPFTNDPDDLIYKTGDFGRLLEDGNFEFCGRRDNQVKLRGHRIELGEIETALNTHSAVAQCAVILRDDALVAYIVASRDSQPSASELRAHLQSRLPDYMMPAYWLFLQRLPLTANGKLDHKALPAVETASRQAQSLSARTPAEEIMCGIWSQVLRRDDFSIEDNFFELGGHSLLATQVISRVRSVFGHELEPAAVLRAADGQGVGSGLAAGRAGRRGNESAANRGSQQEPAAASVVRAAAAVVHPPARAWQRGLQQQQGGAAFGGDRPGGAVRELPADREATRSAEDKIRGDGGRAGAGGSRGGGGGAAGRRPQPKRSGGAAGGGGIEGRSGASVRPGERAGAEAAACEDGRAGSLGVSDDTPHSVGRVVSRHPGARVQPGI